MFIGRRGDKGVARSGGAGGSEREGRAEVGIVKITADVYAFMLSYCRRGFTDVYADLRFVLSAGTHCPRNYYSAVAAASRHPRLLLLLHPRAIFRQRPSPLGPRNLEFRVRALENSTPTPTPPVDWMISATRILKRIFSCRLAIALSVPDPIGIIKTSHDRELLIFLSDVSPVNTVTSN